MEVFVGARFVTDGRTFRWASDIALAGLFLARPALDPDPGNTPVGVPKIFHPAAAPIGLGGGATQTSFPQLLLPLSVRALLRLRSASLEIQLLWRNTCSQRDRSMNDGEICADGPRWSEGTSIGRPGGLEAP